MPYDDPLMSQKQERKMLASLKQEEFKRGCRYCGSPHAITKDHIQPKSRGGTNNFYNLQPLCAYCNGQKGSHTEYELTIIFEDIKTRGVWYGWERRYKNWIDWLEIVCEERNHVCPLLVRQ